MASQLQPLQIVPADATRESIFSIPPAGKVSGIQWFVNGRPVVSAVGSQFSSQELRKGDVVQAKATLNGKAVESGKVVVKNALPTVARAEIIPRFPRAIDNLRVDLAGDDRDGDTVTFKYEWFRNGDASGTDNSLEGPFKRGDRIAVRITPFDGEADGQAITINTQIYNAAPKPLGGDERFENNVYSFRVKASDPDGDPVTFKLRKAPAGLTIEESTGLITWRVAEKDAGRHPVSVQLSDGQGGEVLYSYEVTIGFQQ